MFFTNAGMFTRIVIIAAVTYLVGDLLTVMGEIQRTQAVSLELTEEVEAMREENDRMSHALQYKDDPAMLEQEARKRGYIKVGETIFIDIVG